LLTADDVWAHDAREAWRARASGPASAGPEVRSTAGHLGSFDASCPDFNLRALLNVHGRRGAAALMP